MANSVTPSVASRDRLLFRAIPALNAPVWLAVLILLTALVAGVGLKVFTKAQPAAQEADLRGPITQFLERHAYRVTPAAANASFLRVVALAGFSCRLQVVEASARGYNYDSIRMMAGPTDDFFVVFDGALYDAQPLWRTKVSYYWNRLRGEMGLRATQPPVLAVIASPACLARGLPWSSLF